MDRQMQSTCTDKGTQTDTQTQTEQLLYLQAGLFAKLHSAVLQHYMVHSFDFHTKRHTIDDVCIPKT